MSKLLDDIQARIVEGFKEDLQKNNFDNLYRYIDDGTDANEFTNAFLECGITVDELLSGVTEIRQFMFVTRDMGYVILPKNIDTVNVQGFHNCKFTTLDMHANPNISLWWDCLTDCTVQKLILPQNLKDDHDFRVDDLGLESYISVEFR